MISKSLTVLVSIFVITGYSYGQKLSFDYALGQENIEIFIENDTISYNYKNENFQYQNNSMDADSLYINNEASAFYSKKTLKIDDKKYKFKKPIFSRKAYLIDQTNNKKLIQFKVLDRENKIQVNLTDDFHIIENSKLKDKLKLWSFFKEAKYVYYKESTKIDPENIAFSILTGAIAGVLVN